MGSSKKQQRKSVPMSWNVKLPALKEHSKLDTQQHASQTRLQDFLYFIDSDALNNRCTY